MSEQREQSGSSEKARGNSAWADAMAPDEPILAQRPLTREPWRCRQPAAQR